MKITVRRRQQCGYGNSSGQHYCTHRFAAFQLSRRSSLLKAHLTDKARRSSLRSPAGRHGSAAVAASSLAPHWKLADLPLGKATDQRVYVNGVTVWRCYSPSRAMADL